MQLALLSPRLEPTTAPALVQADEQPSDDDATPCPCPNPPSAEDIPLLLATSAPTQDAVLVNDTLEESAEPSSAAVMAATLEALEAAAATLLLDEAQLDEDGSNGFGDWVDAEEDWDVLSEADARLMASIKTAEVRVKAASCDVIPGRSIALLRCKCLVAGSLLVRFDANA